MTVHRAQLWIHKRSVQKIHNGNCI